MKAHFIGICGVGMAGTAQLLKQAGWEVTGSDEEFYPPMSDFLAHAGIQFQTPYKAGNLPEDIDVIVIGKNAKLVPETNEEVRAALKHGARIASFPEVLGEITRDKHNVVVAGSYGKSTVTALISHVLAHAQKDPSYFIGAVPTGFLDTARTGSHNACIIEGDEYPSSNTDSRSKFLHYQPRDVLLTSAAHDHINIFPTLSDYLAPFHELLSRVPESGKIIACAEAPNVDTLIAGRQNAITYGLRECALWHPRNVTYGEESSFDLFRGANHVARISTGLLGAHNMQNVVGVGALLLERKLVTLEEFGAGIQTFRGIRRRLEKKTSGSGTLVYEGFGSSYEKLRSELLALGIHFPNRRKIVIFEPHTFSWRNRDALAWYDSAFEGADEIFVYHPATQGADTHKQLSQEEIVGRIKNAGFSAHAIADPEQGIDKITCLLKPDDIVLCTTSGDLGGLIPRIVEAAENSKTPPR